MSLSISIAMCTFNGSRFLRSQLESIRAQTRLPDELVICDDRSDDDTVQIVEDFAKVCSFPVHLVLNTSNLGSTKNFEQSISLSTADIVALADQDDVWYPHKLETLLQAFSQDDDLLAVFSDADVIDDEALPLGERLWTSFGFSPHEVSMFGRDAALHVLVKHPVVTGAAMAFRRNMFDHVRPLPPTHVHDEWIAFLVAARGRILPISEPLLKYRRHSSQQLGPGTFTIAEAAARAKATPREAYAREINKFRGLQTFIAAHKESFPLHALAHDLLEAKIRHLRYRSQLPSSKIARLPQVLRETLTGRYWRFSAGWKSVAKDLLLA